MALNDSQKQSLKSSSVSPVTQLTSEVTGYKLTAGSGCVVRKSYSISSERLARVNKGVELEASKMVKDKSGKKWYYVDTQHGWIVESQCETTPLVTTSKYVFKTDKENNVSLYKRASEDTEVVKVIEENKQLTSSRNRGDWYYIDEYEGWIHKSDIQGDIKIKKTTKEKLTEEQKKADQEDKKKKQKQKQNAINKIKDTPIADLMAQDGYSDLEEWINATEDEDIKQAKIDAVRQQADEAAVGTWLEDYKDRYNVSLADGANAILTNDLMGVFGAPYQFNENADEKLEGTQFGITYAEKIVMKMPLLLVTPGKPNFMSSYKEEDRVSKIAELMGLKPSDANDANANYQSSLLAGSNVGELVNCGKYYTFEFQTREYFDYVNGMCWTGARLLGIQDVKITVNKKTSALGSFNWQNAVAEKFKGVLTSMDTIAFYVDSVSTVDEDFSNSETESQLASKINQFADVGREIQFLLGTAVGDVPDWMSQEDLDSTLEDIQSLSDQWLNGNTILTMVAKNFATVATGGKLLFPKIWADSEYSKSYNISIKLRTPDADILSWYLNIYVPLCHLVALTAPHQVSSEQYNGYCSPFLVRAYYKGLFNCDTGMVTSLSISRGKEGSWTLNGLPTEVDVSMQIKDMYNVLSITPSSDVKWFLNNTSLMDYLATNCGININEPDIVRQLDLYLSMHKANIMNLPNRVWTSVNDALSTKLMDMYGTLWSKLPG